AEDDDDTNLRQAHEERTRDPTTQQNSILFLTHSACFTCFFMLLTFLDNHDRPALLSGDCWAGSASPTESILVMGPMACRPYDEQHPSNIMGDHYRHLASDKAGG
ncbi:unnamed protein product, partial [Mycena citricolor]